MASFKFAFLPIFLSISLPQIQCLRILISAPNYVYSHMAMHVAIADLLVEEGGHQVTLLVPIWNVESDYPPKEHSNWTKSQQIVRYSPKDDALQKRLRENARDSPFTQESMWAQEFELFNEEIMENFQNSIGEMCKFMLVDNEFISAMEAGNFDIAISEWFDGCSFALFHRLKIGATVTTSAIPMDFNLAKMLGLPTPVYFPDVNYSPPSGTQMGIWERAKTFYRRMENKMEKYFQWDEWIHEVMGNEFPKHKELVRQSSFVLINTNEYLDLARPSFAKVKQIGGFTLMQKKSAATVNLDAKMMDLLERNGKDAHSNGGAVLVSFGSLADPRKMPPQMLRAFVDTFAAFPEHNFIWKFIEEDEANKKNVSEEFALKMPSNVHKFGWLNQRAILAHSSTRLFISHCGLNSLNEAAYEGIPLLCIPIFGDQNYNSAIVNQRRAGRVLLKSELTAPNLRNALDEMLAPNNQYARNMRIVSRKMKKAPSQPRETILRHVEFAAEFGGEFEELNLEGAKMGVFAYFGMDFILPLAMLSAIGLAILARISLILARNIPKYFHPALAIIRTSFFVDSKNKMQ